MKKRPPFSEEELEVVSYYPKRRPWSQPIPKWKTPITQKDNFRLMLQGKKPYWIPGLGRDVLEFMPRISPDIVAAHSIGDGGPPFSYEEGEVTRKGLFGVTWEYVPIVGIGAITRPGKPLLDTVNGWEEKLVFPDYSTWDWEGQAKLSHEFLQDERMINTNMTSALFSRLISLMDMAPAAMAMIDEEQKDSIHRLFDRLCIMWDEYLEYIHRFFPEVEMVSIEDEWAHQRAPFFSEMTIREMLLPYLKRIVESCHKRGMYAVFLCCGFAQDLAPMAVEAGIDLWTMELTNDLDRLCETYKNEKIVFDYTPPILPADFSQEELDQIIHDVIWKHKDHHVCMAPFDPYQDLFAPYVYKHSRIMYGDEEVL